MKDAKDFLQKLPDQIFEDSILFCLDVESLNSNIPHDLGLKAIEFWMDKYPSKFPSRISNEFVLEGIKIILENNSFHFNDNYFLQTKGTAMGSKFAPIYATLVFTYVEEKMYELSEKDFDSDFRTYLEANFKRLLDDCFLIFIQSEDQLTKFHYLLK